MILLKDATIHDIIRFLEQCEGKCANTITAHTHDRCALIRVHRSSELQVVCIPKLNVSFSGNLQPMVGAQRAVWSNLSVSTHWRLARTPSPTRHGYSNPSFSDSPDKYTNMLTHTQTHILALIHIL